MQHSRGLCRVFVAVLALCLGSCVATAPQPSQPTSVIPPPSSQTMITAVSTELLADAVRVIVQATGTFQYTAFMLQEPARLVVDITGATLGEMQRPIPVVGAIIRSIEPLMLPAEGIVRLTIHLQRMASHTVEVQGQQLFVTLRAASDAASGASKQVQATTSPPAGMPATPPPVPPATERAEIAETVVTDVTFESRPDTSVVVVWTSGDPPKVRVQQRENPLRLLLDVERARLGPAQRETVSVSDPGGVVTQLLTFQFVEQEESTVKVVVHLREPAPFEVRQHDHVIRLVLAKPVVHTSIPATPTPPMPPSPVVEATPAAKPSGPSSHVQPPRDAKTVTSSPTPETAPPVAPPAEETPAPAGPTTIGAQETREFTGEKISLDFQNADINDILRLIAEVSGLNIIAGGDVQGTVTTRMVDVPWDQALDIILKINGLAQEREGNIIRVAPVARLINERQESIRARQTEDQAEPTITQLIPINYADATELRTNMERLLSERGSIFIDSRTNTMIVTDTRKNLDDILALVETLDRQTPQVMIEARIVETSRNLMRDLGIQLGGQYGQITNLRFPSSIGIEGSASETGNFLVDLPAAVTAGSGGAITFALAGASNLLNMRLSALETSGRAKIISNPKIATVDNTEALIQSGTRIPVQTVSAEGTQTEFVDASLSLRVTPHVTPDDFISLQINATKNEPDFGNAVNGVPSITTREATTAMLVRDGDTVVIGGLYRRTISSSRDGVPWVSQVPVLGWLFQKTQNRDENDELLIFITPRIIRQPERRDRARVPVPN